MPDESRAPVFFFAPFVSSTMRIEPAWIDYNGHLNMAYYHVLFDRAVDEAFGIVGLGPEYLEERRASYFTAEIHTRYRRELTARDLVRVTIQLVEFDEKRVHYYCEMRQAADGWTAATAEHLALHVSTETRKVTPFPADILANLAVMRACHARLGRPDDLGRRVGIPAREDGPARAEPPLLAAAGGGGTRH